MCLALTVQLVQYMFHVYKSELYVLYKVYYFTGPLKLNFWFTEEVFTESLP